MFFHHHLNSKTLQKEHKDIYQDFFSRYPLIISCPSVLLWTPIYSVGYGGLVISSKLPARHYIGIKKSEGGDRGNSLVKFISEKNYVPEENNFKKREGLAYWNDRIGEIYENFLKKRGIRERVEIEILEEGPVSRGWHTTRAVVAALSIGLFLWHKLCQKEEIERWKKMPTEKLLKEKKFDEILKLAWRAISYGVGTIEDGYDLLTCLIDSIYPLLFYHEKDPVYFDQFQDLGIDHPNSYYNLAGTMNWRVLRLDELFKLPKESYWALEYAILYIGTECTLRHIYQTQIKYEERLSFLARFIRETFEKTVPKNFREIPYFLQPCLTKKESPGMALFKKYREASVTLSSEFVRHFYELYRTGYTFDKIQEFFKAINLCETFAKVLGQVVPQVDNVCSILNRQAKQVNELGAGVKLITEGVAGDILLVGPYQTVKKTIERSQKEVEDLIGHQFFCEYASWCDGHEGEGVKIEQYLEKDIYSSFVSPQTFTLKKFKEEGKVEVFLISPEEREKRISEFDLLGDLENKKVYIKGKSLSSLEIHSAKATLAILQKFFEKEKNRIEAKELPSMSYRDRNQMESKIVRPLVLAFKKYAGKKLNFVVSGGLGTNFSITFKPDRLTIGLVSKK